MDHRTHRATRRIEGRSAAPGIALAPLVRMTPVKHDARQHRSAAEEHQALVDALTASQEALGVLACEAGDDEAEAILAFQIALLDGDAGLLIVDPGTEARATYRQRRAELAEARKAMASFNGPVQTAAGEPVRVMINVTGLAELATLDPGHVDGIGLMRTEFLFHGREKLPTEEEQYRIYRRMLEWAG